MSTRPAMRLCRNMNLGNLFPTFTMKLSQYRFSLPTSLFYVRVIRDCAPPRLITTQSPCRSPARADGRDLNCSAVLLPNIKILKFYSMSVRLFYSRTVSNLPRHGNPEPLNPLTVQNSFATTLAYFKLPARTD